MKYFGNGLSEKHKELNQLIRKKDRLADAKKRFAEIHENLHLSEVYGGKRNEVDALFGDLAPREYAVTTAKGEETIAWAVWHVARIEDLTLNILVAESEQLFDSEWKERINAACSDTGNAMTAAEVAAFSEDVNPAELLAYRNAVGRRTRAVIDSLTENDMKRKVSARGLDKIKREGGVTEGSEWLLDFWGKKDVAGILLMPPTRHVILHLNDCGKWKAVIRSKSK